MKTYEMSLLGVTRQNISQNEGLCTPSLPPSSSPNPAIVKIHDKQRPFHSNDDFQKHIFCLVTWQWVPSPRIRNIYIYIYIYIIPWKLLFYGKKIVKNIIPRQTYVCRFSIWDPQKLKKERVADLHYITGDVRNAVTPFFTSNFWLLQ